MTTYTGLHVRKSIELQGKALAERFGSREQLTEDGEITSTTVTGMAIRQRVGFTVPDTTQGAKRNEVRRFTAEQKKRNKQEAKIIRKLNQIVDGFMDIDNDGIISEEEALWFFNAVNDTIYSLDEVKHDESEGRAEDLAQLTGRNARVKSHIKVMSGGDEDLLDEIITQLEDRHDPVTVSMTRDISRLHACEEQQVKKSKAGLSAKVRKTAAKLFDRYDLEDSGSIGSLGELQQLVINLLFTTEATKEVTEMVLARCQNFDDSVVMDREEFISWYEESSQPGSTI